MSIFGHTKDVANICMGWATQNLNMIWEQWTNGNSSLFNYIHHNGPRPVVGPGTIASCWELPLLALVHGNYADKSDLEKMLASDPMAQKIEFLIPSVFNGLETYQHNRTNLDKGHLAFFNGMNHVAVLTGDKNINGDAEVVSFWAHTPPPGSPQKGPVPNTLVEFNTIEGLQQIIANAGFQLPVVQIAKPVWR